MRDTYGDAVTLTLFGESHGAAIGAVIEGVAAGTPVREDFLAAQMEKRAARTKLSTARREPDKVRFLSGVKDGFATGTAIALTIENTNTRSGDYAKTANLARPGHADFTAQAKYRGFQDARGGGHFSGRLTAPVVAAGAIFLDMLAAKGVCVATHLAQCGGVSDAPFSDDPDELRRQMAALNAAEGPLAVLDAERGEEMRRAIEAAASEGDSVGGVLETVVTGLPAGLGEPFFTSVESKLAALLFSMPAVKGVEFGAGFGFASLRGSEANDAFVPRAGRIATATNRNGGVHGGITNGMPLVMRAAVKPTPSIYKAQNTVDLETGEPAVLRLEGRHDPCILPRARVVQDSLAAFGLVDLCAVALGVRWQEDPIWSTV